MVEQFPRRQVGLLCTRPHVAVHPFLLRAVRGWALAASRGEDGGLSVCTPSRIRLPHVRTAATLGAGRVGALAAGAGIAVGGGPSGLRPSRTSQAKLLAKAARGETVTSDDVVAAVGSPRSTRAIHMEGEGGSGNTTLALLGLKRFHRSAVLFPAVYVVYMYFKKGLLEAWPFR